MAALWQTVRDDPGGLIDRVNRFEPSADAFERFRDEDGRPGLPIGEAGFRKLALHRLSFGGLGTRAGGPMGGWDQDRAENPVGCRWNAAAIGKQVEKLHGRMRRFPSFRCTCGDFAAAIIDAPSECFLYIDPPYYGIGPRLYKYSMGRADHVRLAGMLRDCRAAWVLSYDDHPAVRDLYGWARTEEIPVIYSTATAREGRRPREREVIITPA